MSWSLSLLVGSLRERRLHRGSWAEIDRWTAAPSLPPGGWTAPPEFAHTHASHFTYTGGYGAANAGDRGGDDSSPAQSPCTRTPRASRFRASRIVTCVGEWCCLRYGSQPPSISGSMSQVLPRLTPRRGGGWRRVCRCGCRRTAAAEALRGGGRGLRGRGYRVASHPADATGASEHAKVFGGAGQGAAAASTTGAHCTRIRRPPDFMCNVWIVWGC